MSPRRSPHHSKLSPSAAILAQLTPSPRVRFQIRTSKATAAVVIPDGESEDGETIFSLSDEEEEESPTERDRILWQRDGVRDGDADRVVIGDDELRKDSIGLEDDFDQVVHVDTNFKFGTSESDDTPTPSGHREWRGLIDLAGEEKRSQKLTQLERQLLAENRALKSQLESVCRKAAQGTKMFQDLLEEDRSLSIKEIRVAAMHAEAVKKLRTLQAQAQARSTTDPHSQNQSVHRAAMTVQTDIVSALEHRLRKITKKRERVQKTMETLMAKAPTVLLPARLPRFHSRFEPKSGQPPASHRSMEGVLSSPMMDGQHVSGKRCAVFSHFVFPPPFDPFDENQQQHQGPFQAQTYRSPVRRPNPHVVFVPKDHLAPSPLSTIPLPAPILTNSPHLQPAGATFSPLEPVDSNFAPVVDEQMCVPVTARPVPVLHQVQLQLDTNVMLPVPPLPKSVESLPPVPAFEPRMPLPPPPPSAPTSLFSTPTRPAFNAVGAAVGSTHASPQVPPLNIPPNAAVPHMAPLPPLLSERLTTRSARRRPDDLTKMRRTSSLGDLENYAFGEASPTFAPIPTTSVSSIPELHISLHDSSMQSLPLSGSGSIPVPPSTARDSARPRKQISRSNTTSPINVVPLKPLSETSSSSLATASTVLMRNMHKQFLVADPAPMPPPSAGGRLDRSNDEVKFPPIKPAGST